MAAVYDKQFFERAGGLDDLKDIKDLPVILQFLDPKAGEKILDVGCGKGRFDGIIAECGAEVTGIDISKYGIEQAIIKWEGRKELQFISMNALEMDYENQFDKVLCYHFIEHLTSADGRILLRKIHNALKSEGILVLGVPINDFTLFRRVIRLIAHRPWRGEPTHIVSYSIKEIKKVITSAGFSISNICPLSYFSIRLPERLPQTPALNRMVICADIRAIKNKH
jgi:2-polyprenyl-3-methyl-5-hydroxy-6-metoxy-1,4-benzoquinol methylase